MKREFKGIWIPSEIWCNKDLSWTEKIMLREIDSLQDNQEGGCYASNSYFAEFFQLSKSRVSEIVSCLVRKKYVRSLLLKYKDAGQIKTRRLLKTTGKGVRKTEGGYSTSRKDYSTSRKSYSGNGEYNNTVNNKSSPEPSSMMSEAQALQQGEKLLRIVSGKFAFPKKETIVRGSPEPLAKEPPPEVS